MNLKKLLAGKGKKNSPKRRVRVREKDRSEDKKGYVKEEI
jgi:hypothetical protein